jgi:hypothetical protein
VAYVTADLTGGEEEGQPPNALGNYELMMCTHDEDEWAPAFIAQLATYTLENKLEPYDTMEIDGAVPRGSTVKKMIFLEPEFEGGKKNEFRVGRKKCGLLLCLGMTAAEFKAFRGGRADEVLEKLREAGVFPYTALKRKSVV